MMISQIYRVAVNEVDIDAPHVLVHLAELHALRIECRNLAEARMVAEYWQMLVQHSDATDEEEPHDRQYEFDYLIDGIPDKEDSEES